MVQGSAWIFTGWTVIGGSVILLGFFFYYDIPEPTVEPPTSTMFMQTTTPFTEACGIKGKPNLSPALGPLISGVIDGRIIGGSTAIDGDWPWMAYIYEKDKGFLKGGICGASLLNHLWVVTAAHCLITVDPLLYGVILGEHTISRTTGREVFRDVIEIKTNNYDSQRYNNDIALLKLNASVSFNKFVRPVCVVPMGTRTDNAADPTFAGALCSTLGWGLTAQPSNARSDILMQLNVRITPDILCRSFTIAGSMDYNFRVVAPGDPKFCAGGVVGEDSCDGDSGGPLVCLHDDGFYYLHGITSYGTNTCAQLNRPGIYTKVANLSDWISETIN